jgi:hypothetical protein
MNFTKEMFVMLAKAMSKEEVIEKLEKAIADYREAKLLNSGIESAEENIHLTAHLFIMNSLNKNPMEIIGEMNKVNQRVKFFDTEKN